MMLTVKPAGGARHAGRLAFAAGEVDCALGRAGIRSDKREGDGATPVGDWPLRRVLYRADRRRAPDTTLPVDAIQPDDGWCDAPDDSSYNRPVKLPYQASAEHMWREDSVYDIVVVLGHNDDPVLPGAGSAIFLHVARPGFAATEGCVALEEGTLEEVLRECGPGSILRVEPA